MVVTVLHLSSQIRNRLVRRLSADWSDETFEYHGHHSNNHLTHHHSLRYIINFVSLFSQFKKGQTKVSTAHREN